jgi:hypothetical protein
MTCDGSLKAGVTLTKIEMLILNNFENVRCNPSLLNEQLWRYSSYSKMIDVAVTAS